LFDKTGKKRRIIKNSPHLFNLKKIIMNREKANYIEQLQRAVSIYGSKICFGLDFVPALLAKKYATEGIGGFLLQLEELFAYMKEQKVYPGMFKPNYGFYTVHDRPLQLDFRGSITLAKIILLIKREFPDMPITFDGKMADIKKSSANYAKGVFEGWDADAMTVHPYMGSDSIIPFAEYCDFQVEKAEGRGAYILDLTSNPGADDFEMKKMASGKTLYMEVAQWIFDNAGRYPGLGAVVGAPDLNGLRDIASFYAKNPDVGIPILIPGVSGLTSKAGGQGGRADQVMSVLNYVGYDTRIARINVSSGLTQPWGAEPVPDDWKKIIVDNLSQYNKQAE